MHRRSRGQSYVVLKSRALSTLVDLRLGAGQSYSVRVELHRASLARRLVQRVDSNVAICMLILRSGPTS